MVRYSTTEAPAPQRSCLACYHDSYRAAACRGSLETTKYTTHFQIWVSFYFADSRRCLQILTHAPSTTDIIKGPKHTSHAILVSVQNANPGPREPLSCMFPCSSTPDSNKWVVIKLCGNRVMTIHLNQVCWSRETTKTCRTGALEDQGWPPLI